MGEGVGGVGGWVGWWVRGVDGWGVDGWGGWMGGVGEWVGGWIDKSENGIYPTRHRVMGCNCKSTY